MVGRLCLLLLIVAFGALALSVRNDWLRIPPDFNPWAPLDVEATPNILTRHKLGRLSVEPALCQRVLATTGIQYVPIPDETTGENCGFSNAVRIAQSSAEVGAAFPLTCRAAVSLALWERHTLQPAAQKLYGVPVAKLEHFGSYSCRNVYGRPNATRSRHATAEAFDVAGFVLADGERIRIVNDWSGPHAEFLREVRNGACRFFDSVLSPDYNAAHHDHLHLDRGPYRSCR